MKFTAEKLRKNSGYVGKVVFTDDGEKFVQCSRSPAVGSIVCVGLTDKDEPMIGWSLVSPEDIDPLTNKITNANWKKAQELAIERAKAFPNYPSGTPHIPNELKAQVEHFKERSKAYFKPEKYSRKDQKRNGKLYKVWVTDDTDNSFNSDMTKNIKVPD